MVSLFVLPAIQLATLAVEHLPLTVLPAILLNCAPLSEIHVLAMPGTTIQAILAWHVLTLAILALALLTTIVRPAIQQHIALSTLLLVHVHVKLDFSTMAFNYAAYVLLPASLA